MIADRGNNRILEIDPRGRVVWIFPRRGDLKPGQTFRLPDDSFFAPDHHSVVVTMEDDDRIGIVDFATHQLVWSYGESGVAGSGPGLLSHPDDAYMLPNGSIIVSDIRNCRIINIDPRNDHIIRQMGSPRSCAHNPPYSFAMPNGDTPLPDGNILVTEIVGSWIEEVTWQGQVVWAVHAPTSYPSDAQLLPDGRILFASWTNPGRVTIIDKQGRTLWSYGPSSGPGMLDHPSLAIMLPNGLIAANDDRRARVVIIDPARNAIVWQYGHKDSGGTSPGFVHIPDGIDLEPLGWLH
ncbi:MAG: NHL repeat-containing protein [Actinomycetota bacterium]